MCDFYCDAHAHAPDALYCICLYYANELMTNLFPFIVLIILSFVIHILECSKVRLTVISDIKEILPALMMIASYKLAFAFWQSLLFRILWIITFRYLQICKFCKVFSTFIILFLWHYKYKVNAKMILISRWMEILRCMIYLVAQILQIISSSSLYTSFPFKFKAHF